MRSPFPALAIIVLLAACTETPDDEPVGVAILGGQSHGVDGLNVQVIGDSEEGFDVVRDLAFNPGRPGELWAVNRGDDSVVIYDDARTGADPDSEHIIDPYAEHFMEEVSSIAFGAPGTFATCQESRNTYNDQAPHNDFMGPALWSSDRSIFGETNPEAVDQLGYDLGSHLDMLHESPYCMGIAWQEDNIYWVFDGYNNAIVRYDFVEDHGPGFDDHMDGLIARALEGEVDRTPGVASHMELDRATGLLYVADTGNSRILEVDTTTGERGDDLPTGVSGFPPDYTEHYELEDVAFRELVVGAEANLDEPSGIAIHDGLLFVTDHEHSRIFAFSMEGELLDWLDLDLGDGLMGITFDDRGAMYVTHAGRDEVIRISL